MNEKKLNVISYIMLSVVLVCGIVFCLLAGGVLPVHASQARPAYVFYANGELYGTDSKQDYYIYVAGVVDQYNPVYSWGPINALYKVYRFNESTQKWEVPADDTTIHVQSTSPFQFVTGIVTVHPYGLYEDQHDIPMIFKNDFPIKESLFAAPFNYAVRNFANIAYFRDGSSGSYWCVAHNVPLQICNDSTMIVSSTAALYKWDFNAFEWVYVDFNQVSSGGSLYLNNCSIYYIKGDLKAITDASGSPSAPAWPPTHGGGHAFEGGYVFPSITLSQTCTIMYTQGKMLGDNGYDNSGGDEPDEPVSTEPVYSYVYSAGGLYYLVDIFGVPSYDSQANVDSAFTYLVSQTGSTNKTFIHPTYFNIKTGYYGGSWLGSFAGPVLTFYTSLKSFSHAYIYSMGSAYISDYDFVRDNFTRVDIPNKYVYREYINGSYVYYKYGYRLQSLSDGTVLLGLWGVAEQYQSVSLRSTAFDGYVSYSYNLTNQVDLIDPFNFVQNYADRYPYYHALAYMTGAVGSTPVSPTPSPEPTLPPGVSPTPTPDPNATPTPTPPTVIIQWPTSTPTPTPFPLDFTIPTLPGGDLRPDVTENVLSQGFEQIRMNAYFGLLATAFSYVPPELQFLVWFLVFVLLLLAVVKLVIHFGG